MKVTTDDLLDAIQRAMTKQEGGEGQTVQELCDATGKSEERVRRGLRNLNREGRLVVTQVRRQAIDGRMFQVPAYGIKQ